MFERRRLFTAVVALMSTAIATPLLADSKDKFSTTLSGYNETTVTLNSPGSGTFVARISKDESSIAYTLTYRDLPTSALQSHIHFGRPGLTGGVVLFLCTNLTPPAGVPMPPACPVTAGTVSGIVTAADVIAVPAQGIDASAAGFAEMIKALRNGAAYANVHTTAHPSGEIRGPLGDDDQGD